MSFILQWIDLLWIPAAMIVVQKRQRWWTLAFLGTCMLMMRLQTEMMTAIGYPSGILPLMHSPVFFRGLGVYSIFYALYLLLALWSPKTEGMMLMASALSLFFLALFVSTLFMLL
ncbi:MAG: hypothetical protein R3D66_06155 [Alphaproteobacteria bacterium]